LILFAILALAAVLLTAAAPFTRARAATASSGALDPRGLTGLSKVWSGAALTNANPLAAGTSTEVPPAYNVYTPPAGFQQFDAGEPSIGSNWKTGSVFFQSS